MSDMKKVIIRDKETGEIHCTKTVAINSSSVQDYYDLAWETAIEDGDVEDFYRDAFSFELKPDDNVI